MPPRSKKASATLRAVPASKQGRPDRPLLRFSGFPARVQALVPIGAEELSGALLRVELADGPLDVPALAVATAPGQSTVRLLSAQPLPAGRYRARLETPADAMDADVEVLGKARARPYPPRLELQARGETEVSIDLLNTGNVDLEVAAAYAIPLEVAGTLGRAIIDGIRTKERGVQRWGVAADSIADSQAGVARLAVRAGVGAVPPGESRRVVGVVRLPDTLEGGLTYVGSWRLEGRNVPMRITVPADRPQVVPADQPVPAGQPGTKARAPRARPRKKS